MPTRKTPLILALLFVIQWIGGCSTPPEGAVNTASTTPVHPANANVNIEPAMEGAKDNAEELQALVKLPYMTEDLAWKEYGLPQGKRLLAVFQLTEDDTKRLVDSAAKIRPGTPVAVQPEKWFPKELTTQNELTGETGVPATSYAADEFLQPPYSEGTLAHIDKTNLFVLEVFAK